MLDVGSELAPVGEPIFSGQHKLRIRQTNTRLVGKLGANAVAGGGVTLSKPGKKLFGELLLLLEVGARRQRLAKCRPEHLLPCGRVRASPRQRPGRWHK